MGKVALIQARMGSSRLPCKALLHFRGAPIMEWVIRRCARSEMLDRLVVAIPDTPQDDVLAEYLEHIGRVRRFGVEIHRGSEDDVLGRMVGAARAAKADIVVRVCADNPLIWGKEIDNLLHFYDKNPCDYAYNHIPLHNKYPDGLGAECLSMELLERINVEAVKPEHREHCLTYITSQPERFRIATFDPPNKKLHHPEMKLDIDTLDDYIALAKQPLHIDMTPVELISVLKPAP